MLDRRPSYETLRARDGVRVDIDDRREYPAVELQSEPALEAQLDASASADREAHLVVA